jgi:hypothetical protein
MLEDFREGFAKHAGERTADLIFAAIIAGGTLAAWFAAPAVNVHLYLTHLQVVSCVFLFLLLIAGSAWASRALTLRRRPGFHMMQHGRRDIWTTVQQPDGSIHTSIAVDLLAKNLTTEPTYLVSPRLVRPRIRGEIFMALVHVVGEGRALLAPGEPTDVSVFLQICGTVELPNSASVIAVLAIADDEGREQRVRVRLRRLALTPSNEPSQAPSPPEIIKPFKAPKLPDVQGDSVPRSRFLDAGTEDL